MDKDLVRKVLAERMNIVAKESYERGVHDTLDTLVEAGLLDGTMYAVIIGKLLERKVNDEV